MHAGRLGEVARISLLGRHGDDLAAVLEHGALAGGRDVGRADGLGVADATGTRLGQVGGHADLEPGRMARVLRVEEVKVSRLLVDHLARARGGALDREIAVRRCGERRSSAGDRTSRD